MGLLSILGDGLGFVDDLHYSGEEKAADQLAAKRLELDNEKLSLGKQQLAFEAEALGAQQDMVLYLVGGGVAVAAVIAVAMMSR